MDLPIIYCSECKKFNSRDKRLFTKNKKTGEFYCWSCMVEKIFGNYWELPESGRKQIDKLSGIDLQILCDKIIVGE